MVEIKGNHNIGNLGVLEISSEALLNVNLADPASVSAAMNDLIQAQAGLADKDSKLTALFLKSASVGFEAAMADMQRQGHGPGETCQAAVNAYAQTLAFLIGTLARNNDCNAEKSAEVLDGTMQGFGKVFCNMFLSFAGIDPAALKVSVNAKTKRASGSVPSVH